MCTYYSHTQPGVVRVGLPAVCKPLQFQRKPPLSPLKHKQTLEDSCLCLRTKVVFCSKLPLTSSHITLGQTGSETGGKERWVSCFMCPKDLLCGRNSQRAVPGSQNVTLKFFFFQKPLRNWQAYKMSEAANCFLYSSACLLFVLIKVTRENDTEKQSYLFQRYPTLGLVSGAHSVAETTCLKIWRNFHV